MKIKKLKESPFYEDFFIPIRNTKEIIRKERQEKLNKLKWK